MTQTSAKRLITEDRILNGPVNALTGAAALLAGVPNTLDLTAGPYAVTLPTPTKLGQKLLVEKIDSTINVGTVSGTIRGVASSISLYWQYETVEFIADSLTSWRPIAGHKTKTALDGAYVTQLGRSNGADDTAWLNAAIAAGGTFQGMRGQTYLLSSALVLTSYTSLEMRGCKIQTTSSFSGTLVRTANVAVDAPHNGANGFAKGTATGTYAPGTTVYTVGTSQGTRPWTVGDWISIFGAGATNLDGVAIPLTTTITAVSGTGSATTITVADPSITSFTSRGVNAYQPLTNISVVGGDWDAGDHYLAASGPAGAAAAGLLFMFVDQLRVDLDSLSAVSLRYAVHLIGCSNFPDSGVGRFNVPLDGFHIAGPARNGHIYRLGGVTGDDALPMLCDDSVGPYVPAAGNITGISWGNINVDAGQSIVKLGPGAGLTISGIRGGSIRGRFGRSGGSQGSAIWIGEDVTSHAMTRGYVGNVDFGLIDDPNLGAGASNGIVALHGVLGARSIRGRVASTAPSTPVIKATAFTNSSVGAIDLLRVEFDVTGPAVLIDAEEPNLTVNALIEGRFSQVSGTTAPAQINAGAWTITDRLSAGTMTAPALVGGTVGATLSQRSAITPLATLLNPAAAVWPAAQRAILDFFDVTEPTVVRFINWIVSVQSGNVQVGLIKFPGSDPTANGIVVGTSGVIACPVVGDVHTDLGVLRLTPGLYALAMWADNVTFQTRNGSASGITSMKYAGSRSSLTTGIGAVGSVFAGPTIGPSYIAANLSLT